MKQVVLDTTSEGFIYLASPYSHSSSVIERERFIKNSKVSARLFAKGVILFAPIVQSPCMARYGQLKGTDWSTWERFDRAIIRECKAVYVLTLTGWKESVGVTAEIVYAISEQIPVYYLDYETLDLTRECK